MARVYKGKPGLGQVPGRQRGLTQIIAAAGQGRTLGAMAQAATIEAPVLDWLLEESNPSVRYFALCKLLGKGPRDAEVRKSAAAIMDSPPVAAILAAQEAGGNWLEPGRFYTGKYRSSVWQLQILAELGVHDMVLLTNTKHALVGLEGYDLTIVGERPIA